MNDFSGWRDVGRLRGRRSFGACRREFVIGAGGRPPETAGAVNACCGEGANWPGHLGSRAPIRGVFKVDEKRSAGR